MRICAKCGNECSDDAKICGNCGTKLDLINDAAEKKPEEPEVAEVKAEEPEAAVEKKAEEPVKKTEESSAEKPADPVKPAETAPKQENKKMRFCGNCGKPCSADAKICGNCGTKLGMSAAAQNVTKAPENAVTQKAETQNAEPQKAETQNAGATDPAAQNDCGLDVFISYSTKNKNVADAIVADFEQHGIKCWYAPRNIMPGQEWVSAIREGLHAAKLFVLIYTDESNESRQVMNEVALAFNAGKTIIPFRLAEVGMNDELEYYLTRVHWLDAVSNPLNQNIEQLRKYVSRILQNPQENSNLVSKMGRQAKAKKKMPKWALPAAAALILVAGIVTFFVLRGPGAGKLMEQGFVAYNSVYHGANENSEAVAAFSEAADKGAADAWYYLGKLEERSFRYESAVQNYETGMDQGSALAEVALGEMYRQGHGVLQDVNKARELYEEALDAGCVEANFGMGQLAQKGLAGFDTDAKEALEYYEDSAESELVEWQAASQEAIGTLYKNGYAGVERDIDKAIECYEESIELTPYREGKANMLIGDALMVRGEDVKADEYYRKALEFYEEASEAGNIEAMNNAGYMYIHGQGTETDGEKAMDYFRKGADQGNAMSMYNVGWLYDCGSGTVKRDEAKAYEWFKKAADIGEAGAMSTIGALYYLGRYGADNGQPDYHMAEQWFQKAAAAGDCTAYRYLGDMYREGTAEACNGKPDYAKMMEYYEKGVAAGDTGALVYIGTVYQYGYTESGASDPAKAVEYYKKAAVAGDSDGMLALAYSYFNGITGNVDYAEAAKWFQMAADEGNAEAMFSLGGMYYNGEFGTPDYGEAAKWFRRAVKGGSVHAMYYLGALYIFGEGVEADAEKAVELMGKAIDNGIPEEEAEAIRTYFRELVNAGAVTEESVAQWLK